MSEDQRIDGRPHGLTDREWAIYEIARDQSRQAAAAAFGLSVTRIPQIIHRVRLAHVGVYPIWPVASRERKVAAFAARRAERSQ